MKNVTVGLGLLLVVFMLVGCKENSEGTTDKQLENVDLETYVKTVELPDNLSITFDPSKVKNVEKARSHTAKLLDFVEQDHVVIDELVQGEIINTENYAEGPWLEAEYEGVTEYLTIYDGGESVGMDSGMNGGFSYGIQIDDLFLSNKLSSVIELSPGPPGNIAQEFGYDLKSDYGSSVNLDFMDYTDALSGVEDILYAVGLPEVSVAETYSVDLDTMIEHYDLYLDSRSSFGIDEEEDKYTWSKDDEFYLFFFRQIVDDIPLVGVSWPQAKGMPGEENDNPNEIGYTSIDVLYSKEGIIDLTTINMLDMIESGEEQPLINGSTALGSVIDSYSEILIGQKTELTSMELSYVTILVGENNYQLVPAWVFEIAEENEWKDPVDDTTTTYDEYSYYVVNAMTGARIEKASDIK